MSEEATMAGATGERSAQLEELARTVLELRGHSPREAAEAADAIACLAAMPGGPIAPQHAA